MKPRNKHELLVTELSLSLKPLTDEHKNYGYEKGFEHKGVVSRKTLSCLECGHSEKILFTWHVDHTCKNCNKELKVQQHNSGRYYISRNYIGVLETVKDFQVVRVLYVEKVAKRKDAATFHGSEVIQHWIHTSGKTTILAKRTQQSIYYIDSWVLHDELSIKNYNNRYFLDINIIYPKKKIHPVLKRNGFKNNFHDLNPARLFKSLLLNPQAETLLKSNQIPLLQYNILYDSYYHHWSSIKICIRNNYIVKDVIIWNDYINLLTYFGKDLTNAKYVCPKDLHKEHDKFLQKKIIAERKKELIKRQKELEKEERAFLKEKKKFLKLHFTDGNIVIEPLKSVEEFIEEGKIFKHCVYINEYYKKQESLILSAKIKDKKIETIEVNLSQMKIEQSRGLKNKATRHNKKIVALVNNNLHQIKKIITARKKVSPIKI